MTTRKFPLAKYQGGLSNEVFEVRALRHYLGSGFGSPGGYVGSSYRTKARDAIVEKALRLTGLGPHGVACWLTSTSARHMMDSVDRRTSIEEFKRTVTQYTKGAFVEVTIWNHPDFGGNELSRHELVERLRQSLPRAVIP